MNALRAALGIFSGKIISNFGTAERLRTLRCPVFTERDVAGNWLFAVRAPTVKKGLQKRPQAFLKPSYKNEIPLIMARAKAAAIQIVIPPKGAQDHIRSISASTSSMRVAQLVAMRTTVWVSSNFSQKPNFALPSSAASWAFSSTRKTWFVGESMKKR